MAFPVWLPERPHLRFRGSHLAREGRLARASALLLMHRQWSCVSFVIRQEGGTVKTDSDRLIATLGGSAPAACRVRQRRNLHQLPGHSMAGTAWCTAKRTI